MSTYLTADFHLGENRFELMDRPFKAQMEMVETLIRNFNAIVKPEDELIIVGDVCYQHTPEFLPHIAEFNGRKTLIRGNHDRVFTDDQLWPYFDQVVADGDGIETTVGDVDCYITHYPTQGRKFRFNLVGHIHSGWKYQLNMYNVGIDVNHFLPVPLESIPARLKAITEFYDRDVWVAYNEINSIHVNNRGKKSRYLDSL